MLSFTSDYIAGAHPEIIKRLTETNLENLSGYGTDKYCERAIKKIAAIQYVTNFDNLTLIRFLPLHSFQARAR